MLRQSSRVQKRTLGNPVALVHIPHTVRSPANDCNDLWLTGAVWWRYANELTRQTGGLSLGSQFDNDPDSNRAIQPNLGELGEGSPVIGEPFSVFNGLHSSSPTM